MFVFACVQVNDVGALLGNYKWGYTDLWCNMTKAGGPDGCRALLLKVAVTMADGSVHTLETAPGTFEARAGPVVWDHFFHGETVQYCSACCLRLPTLAAP